MFSRIFETPKPKKHGSASEAQNHGIYDVFAFGSQKSRYLHVFTMFFGRLAREQVGV